MFAGIDEAAMWREEQKPVVHDPDDGETSDHEQPDVKLDAEERTPEEAGYGYGV